MLNVLIVDESSVQAVTSDGYAVAEQLDGTLVADALLNARHIRFPPRLSRMVLESRDGYD